MQAGPGLFEQIAVEPSGEILAASNAEFEIILFDIQAGKQLDVLKLHGGPIT